MILYVLILTWSYHGSIITLCRLNTLNHFPRRDKPNSHAAALTERSSGINRVPLRCSVLICVWQTLSASSGSGLPPNKVDQMKGIN